MIDRETCPQIFIVEDEVLVATELKTRLKALGYGVSGMAVSGEQALVLIEREQPDLVLMDIALKGEMDGIETAEIIRNRWRIPVVLLTAYSESDRLERAKLTYPFGYILKPYQDRELKIALEMALYVSRVDAERRMTEERYRSLFISTNDGICLHEMIYRDGKPVDYRILDINPKYEAITGILRQDAIGALASKLYESGEPPFLEIYHNVVVTGEPVSFETYFPPMKKHFLISAYSPGRDRFATMFQDITALKVAQDVKESLESQLRQAHKMEAVGTLAGGIAHDFNNLLQAISGYTQILLMDKNRNHPDYHNLQSIQKAGNRAAELIKQLLLFSRKIDSERRPIELNRAIEQARIILERTIPKMIHMDVHYGSRLWTINADPVQMEQILLNLGKNAADAMPAGGKLTIETENIVLTEDYAQSHLDATAGNYVLLTVSDTGRGMDRETLAHIFEPFYTTKGVGQGTGLGLASAYGIVKNHGGYITCYSEITHGTTFKIYLPAIEREDCPAPKESSGTSPQRGTETILLVDDESYIRDFATQSLERFGYTVLTAACGEEALEIYTGGKYKIDLVLLDIGMPGMGGYRCLEELLNFDPNAKVVIASGYSINGHIKSAREAGAQGYVGKPYQLTDLLSKVREILDEKVF